MFRSGRTVSPRGRKPRGSERKCPWRFFHRDPMFGLKIGDHALSAEATDARVLLAAKSHNGSVNCGQIIDMSYPGHEPVRKPLAARQITGNDLYLASHDVAAGRALAFKTFAAMLQTVVLGRHCAIVPADIKRSMS